MSAPEARRCDPMRTLLLLTLLALVALQPASATSDLPRPDCGAETRNDLLFVQIDCRDPLHPTVETRDGAVALPAPGVELAPYHTDGPGDAGSTRWVDLRPRAILDETADLFRDSLRTIGRLLP